MANWNRDTTVKGLSELQAFMDKLPAKVEANILRGALRAGMRKVLPVARSKINNVSGLLAAGLGMSTRLKDGQATCTIYTAGPHGYIGRFLEFGVRAHFISVQENEKNINRKLSVRRGRVVRESMRTINRRTLIIGSNFVGPTVWHKGIAKGRYAFMRPALDQQAGAAVLAAAEYMRKRLETKEGMDTAEIDIEVFET